MKSEQRIRNLYLYYARKAYKAGDKEVLFTIKDAQEYLGCALMTARKTVEEGVRLGLFTKLIFYAQRRKRFKYRPILPKA